jgi:hypothetical protein
MYFCGIVVVVAVVVVVIAAAVRLYVYQMPRPFAPVHNAMPFITPARHPKIPPWDMPRSQCDTRLFGRKKTRALPMHLS